MVDADQTPYFFLQSLPMRTFALSLGLLGTLFTACGTIDRRIDPESPDAVGGATLDSLDILAMSDQMARDIQASGILRSATPENRVTFYITNLRNDSSEPIDNEIILTRMRTRIARSLGRKVRILDRSSESMSEIKEERRAKREGAVTQNPGMEGALAGSDYVLNGTIKDRVKQGRSLKSVYYLVTFQLTDLETSELSWTNDYEVKFESEKSVISR